MKTARKLPVVAATALAALSIVTTAWAAPGSRPPRPSGDGVRQCVAEKCGTELGNLAECRAKARQDMRACREECNEAHAAAKAACHNHDPAYTRSELGACLLAAAQDHQSCVRGCQLASCGDERDALKECQATNCPDPEDVD